MKISKLTLIIALLGIITLTLLTQTSPIQTATISSIQTYPQQTIIKIQESQTELIIFDNLNLDLKQGSKIKFQGKSDTYKDKSQVIISKISKIR